LLHILDAIVLIAFGLCAGVMLVRYGVGLGYKMKVADERGIPLDHVDKNTIEQDYTR
jgi:hypothetical protein